MISEDSIIEAENIVHEQELRYFFAVELVDRCNSICKLLSAAKLGFDGGIQKETNAAESNVNSPEASQGGTSSSSSSLAQRVVFFNSEHGSIQASFKMNGRSIGAGELTLKLAKANRNLPLRLTMPPAFSITFKQMLDASNLITEALSLFSIVFERGIKAKETSYHFGSHVISLLSDALKLLHAATRTFKKYNRSNVLSSSLRQSMQFEPCVPNEIMIDLALEHHSLILSTVVVSFHNYKPQNGKPEYDSDKNVLDLLGQNRSYKNQFAEVIEAHEAEADLKCLVEAHDALEQAISS